MEMFHVPALSKGNAWYPRMPASSQLHQKLKVQPIELNLNVDYPSTF